MVTQLDRRSIVEGLESGQDLGASDHRRLRVEANKDNVERKGVERTGFLFEQCEKREIKVVLVLADNWYGTAGSKSIAAWSKTCRDQSEFFTDQEAQEYYKETINYLTYRTNSITKRRYRDDPTIMAWNLANEARAKRKRKKTWDDGSNRRASI